MSVSVTSLNWNDRFALIDHFNPSDSEIVNILEVTESELKSARSLRNAGTLVPTENLKYEDYSGLFSNSIVRPTSTDNTTVKPQTSTKTTSVKKPGKKRGRSGDKIALAYHALPSTPTPLVEFANTHGISTHVLQQKKRFKPADLTGTIKTKTDKTTKLLTIWREE